MNKNCQKSDGGTVPQAKKLVKKGMSNISTQMGGEREIVKWIGP